MPPSHLAGVGVPTTSRVCANRYLYRVSQTATKRQIIFVIFFRVLQSHPLLDDHCDNINYTQMYVDNILK